ncbi:DUF3942 family protein [Bacillus cereus]|uniref:DUF3942 family protein n=1 Tax=Bacillus cereus TaxID=1396 RepID=UPI0027D28F8D|nr:DUF3942 family protein [Bacillus cereus]
MNKLNETVSKLKAYVGEDQEEKVLREKFNQLNPIFKEIDKQFEKPSKKEHLVCWSDDRKFIEIENTCLEFSLNQKNNVIEVNKIVNSHSTKSIDEIGLKGEELYCKKREENFTEDVFNDFLNEAFVEILG